MKYLFVLLFIAGLFSPCYSQKDSMEINTLQIPNLPAADYEIPGDSIEIIVIQHFPALFYCGCFATASITIGKTNQNDTLRVLVLCGMDSIPAGTHLFVLAARKPPFWVIFPAQGGYEQKQYNTAWGGFEYRKP
jgi:hypothetical protein